MNESEEEEEEEENIMMIMMMDEEGNQRNENSIGAVKALASFSFQCAAIITIMVPACRGVHAPSLFPLLIRASPSARTRAMRRFCLLCSMCVSSDVLPLPRNPLSSVTPTRSPAMAAAAAAAWRHWTGKEERLQRCCPGAGMAALPLRARARGAMLGLALGDALGATLETMKVGAAATPTTVHHHHHHHYHHLPTLLLLLLLLPPLLLSS